MDNIHFWIRVSKHAKFFSQKRAEIYLARSVLLFYKKKMVMGFEYLNTVIHIPGTLLYFQLAKNTPLFCFVLFFGGFVDLLEGSIFSSLSLTGN